VKTGNPKGRKRARSRAHKQKVSTVSGLALSPGLRDIKVRLCNSQGKYLCVVSGGWAFSPDCARALVLDYYRDAVEQYVRRVAAGGGPILKPVALDPGEFLERCDRCHLPLETVNAFFDGTVVLCPRCRARHDQYGLAKTAEE
jgi:hypothetical protein